MSGTGLAGSVDVVFGDQRATVLSATGTTLTVQVPAQPPGSTQQRIQLQVRDVTVNTNPSGRSGAFTVV